tara:strand:+ start:653 stop:1120 length:468 start_codon:yes stop_codon:yes gene_type:complete
MPYEKSNKKIQDEKSGFKMKSGSTGPMYKNYGVGEPMKKYGHSSNKMAHEAAPKMAHESSNKMDHESMAKQTSKDIKKSVKQQNKANTKIDKNNAKITAYNNSVQDLKKFIADNTSGEVGDSTKISVPSTIQGALTMEAYEKKVKELNKLKKKIK